jgi:hypothetical protein
MPLVDHTLHALNSKQRAAIQREKVMRMIFMMKAQRALINKSMIRLKWEVAKGKCVPKFSDVCPVPREPILYGRLSDYARKNEMQVPFVYFHAGTFFSRSEWVSSKSME